MYILSYEVVTPFDELFHFSLNKKIKACGKKSVITESDFVHIRLIKHQQTNQKNLHKKI